MRKRIMVLALAALLLFTLTGAALAETVKTQASDGSLWVRQGPGTEYGKETYVKNGQSVTVLEKGEVWSKIQVDASGKVGYIKTKYLSGAAGGSSSAATVKTKAADGSLWVRKGPGTNYGKETYVKNGQSITVLEKGAVWSKIKVDSSGKVGYIKTQYISGSSSSGGSSLPGGNYEVGRVVTKYANSRVNLRKGPGTNYAVAATYARGALAQITGSDGGWYIVRMSDGQSGYISKSYVSLGVAGKATANVNLRSGAGTGYGVIKVVAKGTSVTVLAVSGSWRKVSVGGSVGYLYGSYVSY